MSLLTEASERLAQLTGLPLPLGSQEPVVEGAFAGMERGDWVVAGPRERVGAVLRGASVERLVDPASGARPYKLAPTSMAPGDRALHAVGLALATDTPVLCLLGLASAASGAFHEACNAAALTGAKVVFVVSVLTLGSDAPVSPQLRAGPAELARAHGLHADRVAGTVEAVRAGVAAARASGLPTLLEVHLEQ